MASAKNAIIIITKMKSNMVMSSFCATETDGSLADILGLVVRIRKACEESVFMFVAEHHRMAAAPE
jgi:hypothetical protein